MLDDTLRLLALPIKLQVSVVPDLPSMEAKSPQRTQLDEMLLKATRKLTKELMNCFTGNKTNPLIFNLQERTLGDCCSFAKQNNLHC